MNKKTGLLKTTINPFTLIFWALVVVVMAVIGLLLKWKKADMRKK